MTEEEGWPPFVLLPSSFLLGPPLTPALSPEYRGEGVRFLAFDG
jgi:hypothetical protein